MQQAATVLVKGAGALTFIGFAAGDSASSVMKFAQILKVYNRLKYIGVNFGDNLD